MGSDSDPSWPEENPAHRVKVNGFWMDETEVTNAHFQQFVQATGYVTTAEKAPTLEEIKSQLPPDAPEPSREKLVPGSLVFTPPKKAVPLTEPNAFRQWWAWVPGASWRHPSGPESNIEDKDNHPVVHVSWEDATAYALWAGKRLPTEAEWECAARAGLKSKPYIWGDQKPSDEAVFANIWQGTFPHHNTVKDGFVATAPVKSFKPNRYGLFDMAGNVWEWCSDWYDPRLYLKRAGKGVVLNPTGPKSLASITKRRVNRGGSFLCNDSYCSRYRPSARHGTAPDTGMSHIGFRCASSHRIPNKSQQE